MESRSLLIFVALSSIASAQAPGVEDARIHIDQFGYLPAGQKIAVISSPQMGCNAPNPLNPSPQYRVKRCCDHATVFQGALSAWNSGNTDAQSGDKVWWFDFSAFSTNGRYYLYDSLNNLRSYPFLISDCTYAEPLFRGLRTFFYRRCGAGKATAFADPLWADPAPCHRGNLQDEACYSILNPPPATAKDLQCGCHDAGDYNKYVAFTYGPSMDLLLAYEENPAIWGGDMAIPESGNGIPDILDELKYELEWLLRMQQSNGSVLCVVGTKNFVTASPPSADHRCLYTSLENGR